VIAASRCFEAWESLFSHNVCADYYEDSIHLLYALPSAQSLNVTGFVIYWKLCLATLLGKILMLILEVSHVFPMETQWTYSMLMHVKDKGKGCLP